MTIEDGGPAFPRTGFYHSNGDEAYDNPADEGMSLRAWLMGRYVVAFASPHFTSPAQRAEIITHALAYADDTIAALDKESAG